MGAVVGIAFAVWFGLGADEWGQRLALTGGDARRILVVAGLPRRRWHDLAHLASCLFAARLAMVLKQVIREVKPSETLTIADYQVTLDRVSREPGPTTPPLSPI